MSQSVSATPLLAAWQRTLERKSGAIAIRSRDGTSLRTFNEIEAEVRELSPLFDPFPPRSAVALQIGNSESWPALLLALFCRGLVPLPLGRHVEAGELQRILGMCGAAALVVTEDHRIAVRRQPGPWLSHACEFLKLTSGTTNAPRAVCFQASQLLADCENICATMGISERDINFGAIPFSHSYGFSNLITPLLAAGVGLVVSEDRMPRAILNDLERSGATVFPGMPVFFDKLADLEGPSELSSLGLCISAGAPLSRRVAERFSRRFNRKIHTFYGSSECGGIGYDSSEEMVYEDAFAGHPMRGVNVTPESAEGAGRIVIRGAAVGSGYFPEDDPATLSHGRFVPGDLVTWSERGMHIVGRASDVINIAGRKLHPGEIESLLAGFSGVRQVIVFGVPSALRGEEPVACVAGEGIDLQALLRFCQARLSQWQIPRDFWIVSEIPSNERGKVSRRELARLYASRSR